MMDAAYVVCSILNTPVNYIFLICSASIVRCLVVIMPRGLNLEPSVELVH